MKIKIAVEGMEFFAYHGYYEAENQTGHTFLLDVYVDVNQAVEGDIELEDSIDYASIYRLTYEIMQEREQLLETVGQKIIRKIKSDITNAGQIKVVIRKCMPQLGGKVRYASVTLKS